jgi:tetratricopeptide (TPR) repeat protein
MAAFHRFERAANREALACFTRAFELDPGFAAALGMAARCYAQRKGFAWITDHASEAAEALRLARAAAHAGRDDAIALAAAGFALVLFGEMADGDAFLERALALNPNLAWAWHIGGFAKACCGQPDAAVAQATHAMRLSPQDPQYFAMQAVAALGHFLAGRDQEAHASAQAAQRELPNFTVAAGVAAASAALLGRDADAADAVARLLQIDPERRLSNLALWLPFRRPDDMALWTEGLRKAGLPE